MATGHGSPRPSPIAPSGTSASPCSRPANPPQAAGRRRRTPAPWLGGRGGGRAASAHTGAVAGDQRVFRALVEEGGGAWARDPHELLELARVLAAPRARPRRRGGLGILPCSGGDSSIAADEA